MKKQKLLRYLGMIVLLTILTAVIPAAPVFAADVSLSVTSGKIGDSVTFTGTAFSASTDTNEKYARIIFSSQYFGIPAYPCCIVTIGHSVQQFKPFSAAGAGCL